VSASASVTFANNMTAGDKLDCYLSFLRADGTVASETAYLEHTVTA